MNTNNRRMCLTIIAASCLLFVSLPLNAGQAPPGMQQPAQPPPPPPKKKVDTPIDPNETAGVRGGGYPIVVRVQLRGKAVPGAHVVVKTPEGDPVGDGSTNPSGVWKLTLEGGDYVVTASSDGGNGETKAHVIGATKLIIVEVGPVPITQ